MPGLPSLVLVRVVPVPCQWHRRSGTVPPRPPHNLHIRLRLPLSCRQPLTQVKSQDQTSCQTTQWMAGLDLRTSSPTPKTLNMWFHEPKNLQILFPSRTRLPGFGLFCHHRFNNYHVLPHPPHDCWLL